MPQTSLQPDIAPGGPPHAAQDIPAPPHFPGTGWRWLDRIVAALVLLGGVCLLAIVVIVTLGVVMRYAFGTPLLGVNEFVQLTAVALVMAALPYCTAGNDHVAVDVFENTLGRWGRFTGDILSRLLAGIVLSILTQRAWVKVLDAWEWGDATNMLRMPIWPFYLILAAGAGLCVVIFAAQILGILRRGAR